MERFKPPSGWGVLRTGRGLLLWLQLLHDEPLHRLVTMGIPRGMLGLLRFEGSNLVSSEIFGQEGKGIGLALRFSIKGVDLGGQATPVMRDEGLLRPMHQGDQIRVGLERGFGDIVQEWLMRSQQHQQSPLQLRGSGRVGLLSTWAGELPGTAF